MYLLMPLLVSVASAEELPPTSAYAVIVAAGDYTDFPNAERPGNIEACLGFEEHLIAQGLSPDRVTALCGESASKNNWRVAVEASAAAAQKDEAPLALYFSGHIVNMASGEQVADTYFVPSDGFNPGAESSRLSLVADDELVGWITDAAPELALISMWFDSVNDPQATELTYGVRVGPYRLKLSGLPPQATAHSMTVHGDSDQAPVLLRTSTLCWVKDEERPGQRNSVINLELRQGELEHCVQEQARSQKHPWYRSYDRFQRLNTGTINIILFEYPDERWSPPQLGENRHWWIAGGGYALAAGSLGFGLYANSQYTNYAEQLREIPFQGSPSDEALVFGQARAAERQTYIGFGVALSAATMTSTYLWVRYIKQRRAGQEELEPDQVSLTPWVTPSSAGLTYRF